MVRTSLESVSSDSTTYWSIVARSDSTIPARKCCIRNSTDSSVDRPRSESETVDKEFCEVELPTLAVGLGGPDGGVVAGRFMGRFNAT